MRNVRPCKYSRPWIRQQYSTSHALINTTENIRKALDDGNIGC